MYTQSSPPLGHYTYIHQRADDGKVFYVGRGVGRRAWRDVGRSAWWKRVDAKHGRKVDVLAVWPTAKEANEHEKFLIACFRDLGAPLVNLTNGGDGRQGYKMPESTKQRISEANSGRKRSLETRAKIAAARTGRPLSEAHKRSLSEAGKGRKDSAETIAKRVASQRASRPKYEEGGLRLTTGEWAVHLGTPLSTIKYRVAKGLTPSGANRR